MTNTCRRSDFFSAKNILRKAKCEPIGIPVRFSRTPGAIRRLAPWLNEHREEILQEATDTSAVT